MKHPQRAARDDSDRQHRQQDAAEQAADLLIQLHVFDRLLDGWRRQHRALPRVQYDPRHLLKRAKRRAKARTQT
jgi:hypothetical protein